MVISYALLYHLDHHAICLVRRILAIFLTWMSIGLALFYYIHYFPLLLTHPSLKILTENVMEPLHKMLFVHDHEHSVRQGLIFNMVVIPTIMTFLTFICLAPILCQKQPISKTLLQNGDLRFFGDPFPEKLVTMSQLRRRPKLSAYRPYEKLLSKNMQARLKNLFKRNFWKLWWKRVVCKYSLHWLLPLWLPIAFLMVLVHSLPIFAVWSNFTRRFLMGNLVKTHKINETQKSVGRKSILDSRAIRIPLLILLLFGYCLVYLMLWFWLLLYGQFFAFLFIDVLRNVTYTLPRCIILFSILAYIKVSTL